MSRRARQLCLPLACLAAALFAAMPPAAAAVPNGGFEANGGSLAHWTVFNNNVGNVVAATLTPRSGTHVAKLFGGFNGSPNSSGVLQNQVSFPQQSWRARVYARHNTGDSLAGTPNYLVLKIEFYRVAGAAYGSADMLQETAITILHHESPTDAWIPASLQVRSPPGAVEARVVLVFVQKDNYGGAALIDDVSFEPAAPWITTWADEFDAPAVDTAKWNIVDGYTGGNNEQNYYAPDEVYTDNGNLVLRSQVRWYGGKPYTSGQVNTAGRFTPVFGRIEVRAKLPWGRGYWPAHWLLPAAGGWPPEIDLMELIGSSPWCVTMSQHWGPLPPGTYPWDIGQTANTVFCGADYTAGFHTFALEWWPGQLFWYIDDVLRFSSLRSQVPQEPMFLILNTAVGGNWPGWPDGSTPFPGYHLIDYVRYSVPGDAGDPLVDFVDENSQSATADGAINPGEYTATCNGINAGLMDRIGQNSTFHVDSGADSRVRFAFRSQTAWQTTGNWGAVIYVDSVYGGESGTQYLTDRGDLARRMASGKGSGSQRADLTFPLGFTADFAICCQAGRVTILQLSDTSHTFVNGAELNAAADDLGGHSVAYRVDDGSFGGRIRELELPLAAIGVDPGEAFNCFVTLINGETGFRANEFIGVAPGNAFDSGNIGPASALLKLGDFIRFRTTPRWFDFDVDAAVTSNDFLVFRHCLGGPGFAPAPAEPPTAGQCLNRSDRDQDSDVDLADFAAFQSAVGTAPGQ